MAGICKGLEELQSELAGVADFSPVLGVNFFSLGWFESHLFLNMMLRMRFNGFNCEVLSGKMPWSYATA